MQPLTRAQQMILEMIKNNPNIGSMELRDKMNVCCRTVVTAVKVLTERKLIKKIRLLDDDMRKVYYVATSGGIAIGRLCSDCINRFVCEEKVAPNDCYAYEEEK